jgi:probable rRNA maturation factor
MTVPHPTSELRIDVDVVLQTVLPVEIDLQSLPSLAEFVLRAEKQRGRWDVAIVFTDDAALRALHRDFMGIDSETDVMTFPSGDSVAESQNGGDIVISIERAADNARDVGHSTREETRFLVVHGLLHLCGWNDDSEADRLRMLDRQQELLVAFSLGSR